MQDYSSLGEVYVDLCRCKALEANGILEKAAPLYAKLHLDDDAGRIESLCKARYGQFSVEAFNRLCGEVCVANNLSDYEAKRLPPREFLTLAHAYWPKTALTEDVQREVAIPPDSPDKVESDAESAPPAKTNSLEVRHNAGAHRGKCEWLGKALLTVRDHPDWSDAMIAQHVGRNKAQLSRSPEYQTAAAMAREKKTAKPKGFITADSETGTHDVEAVAPTDSQPDDKSDRGQPIEGSSFYREYCAQCDEPMRVAGNEVGTNPLCGDCKD